MWVNKTKSHKKYAQAKDVSDCLVPPLENT
jgi:hypothetical protein